MQTAAIIVPDTETMAKCRRIIDGHLQRELIREDDVGSWLKDVVGRYGELAVWHAIRAGGFGGSEIGVLVRNHQGRFGDHQASAHDIVEGKLLRRTPDQETGHLQRGHDNEPVHAQKFYAKYGAHRDEAAFRQLTSGQGPRVWMRYSPDEVALVPIAQPNPALGGQCFARWLGDYKAPSTVDDDEQIAFQYSCQLHSGAIICAHLGIHLDGMVLSQYDWARWRLKDDFVHYDPQLARLILAAGDHYWDGYVMQGRVPRYITRPEFDKQEEVRKEWDVTCMRIAQLKALHGAIEKQLDALEQPFKAYLGQYRLSDSRLSVADLNVSAVVKVDHEKFTEALPEDRYEELAPALVKTGGSADYDAKRMAAYLRAQGVSLKQFAKTKYDGAKVYEFCVANDLDPEQFITEEIRMVPLEGLKEQARQTIALLLGGPGDAEACDRIEHDGRQDDREGRDTERSAPRSISA